MSITFPFNAQVSFVILFAISSLLLGNSFCSGCVVSSFSEFPLGGVQKVKVEVEFLKNELWLSGWQETISLKEREPRCCYRSTMR